MNLIFSTQDEKKRRWSTAVDNLAKFLFGYDVVCDGLNSSNIYPLELCHWDLKNEREKINLL